MERSGERKGASEATTRRHREVSAEIAALRDRDCELVERGFLAPPRSPRVDGGLGGTVWDLDQYAFVDDPAFAVSPPETVNPSLWRQARLNNVAGLFEVTDGVYQVRGLDLANVTFVAGETGWVVIDPLTATETAAAALALVNEHLGERPVRAVLYTHSHVDHYGGVRGVVAPAALARGEVPILAPAGFVDAVVREQVIAGPAMLRRATYMYGVLLARDARGHVDSGLGKGVPALSSSSLVPPTLEITRTGESVVLDGVRLVFHLTPDTEAPAEMNIALPDHRALCVAENCTATQHNLYTPRGAAVRDALQWSKYIDEAIVLFADDVDVVFASHHWPRWGHDAVVDYLASQRDAYRYLHDQTMRLANHGLTMNEIAERMSLPDALHDEFFNREYYGTVSHNAKAVYQRYLGWFDANPAHLWPHPPVEAARRYVEYMGGAEAVLARAEPSMAEGDYRWVAEVVNHVVFAEPQNEAARLVQADALEQLGYQAESGPWRDFYLTGALELRAGGTALRGVRVEALGAAMVASLSPERLFDLLGVRLDGPATASTNWRFAVDFTDRGETWTLTVARGVLHARAGRPAEPVTATLTTTLGDFAQFAAGSQTLERLLDGGGLAVAGDLAAVHAWRDALDTFNLGFEIVLPQP